MSFHYTIGPSSMQVAGLGNSPTEFYLEPDAAGALPIECDTEGKVILDDGQPRRTRRFKDLQRRAKRQGSLFRVFRLNSEGGAGEELTLGHQDVQSMEWTIHLANKKVAGYGFAALEGNLLYGPEIGYEYRKVPLRYAGASGPDARRKLIIDSGPRTIKGAGKQVAFDAASAPPDHKFVNLPA
jgi:L-lysine 6-oxidase